MYYTGLVIGLIIIIVIACKIISFSAEPDFSLYEAMTEEGLANKITILASDSRFYSTGGKGLSLKVIEKQVKKSYKSLSRKNPLSMFDFEKWLFDNFYKIEESISRQKSYLQIYKKLPHTNGLPRIYKLAEYIIKFTNAGYTKEDIARLTEIYNSISPLTFFEISVFKSVLEYALLEYITIFYAKSVVISTNFKKAVKDIDKQKFNLDALKYNSYIYRINLCDNIEFKYLVDNICRSNGLSMEDRSKAFVRLTAYYNSCIGSAIRNLHKSVELDDSFIIELSALNGLLKGYPLYNEDTLATKYAICHEIGKIAKKKNKSELYIARRLMDDAEINSETIEKKIFIKHKGLGLQRLFIISCLILSLLFSFFGAYFIGNLLLIPLLFPISFAVIGFLQAEIFSTSFKTVFLPRIEIDNIKKTMITVTRLIKDATEVEEAFKHLEALRAANGNKLFVYALLIDFIDSDSESCETDNELIALIKEKYEILPDNSDFKIFIRSRRLCGDGKYRGWEKKRGALLQLNDYVINGNKEPFKLIFGDFFSPEYIITLDCDTLINCASELVRIMEHPANADINILSLNMRVKPEAAEKTKFSDFMANAVGPDSYSRRGVDIEYDLFGQGNYTGKGIYRVAGFNKKVSCIFRDERILSHDFIEGAVAGCANCGEYALEDYPSDFSHYLSRQLRWLRGDWQLLPFLFGKIKNQNNKKITNPITPIAKYHIFTNVLFSLIPIAQLSLLFISMFFSAYKLILAAFVLNFLNIINCLRISVLKNPLSAFKELKRQIYSVITLPTVAVQNFIAIITTLIRMLKGKNLLIWQTSAHFHGKISFLPNYIFGLIFLVGAIFINPIYLILFALFILGSSLNIILSLPKKTKKVVLKNKNYIKTIALKTWKFFEDNLKEEYNYLIPDNIRENNHEIAERTSPTNIGFSLIAVTAAYRLEFIDKEKFIHLISGIIGTIEKLEKRKGHLYNWINIKTLKNLSPKYVSTVDSGNLMACLIYIKNYCDKALQKRIETLIDEMDFSDLYDPKRGLLKIGYNESEKQYSENYYDLMGSESILTYLCAIGYGKIENGAWNNLSRQCVRYKGKMLFSWTGGMFEYLMNSLFFEYNQNTLLYKSSANAVKSQFYYAKKNKLPYWGISESQYNSINEWGNYQYKAFGVPQIALSNFKGEKVIAPYASILAYKFSPENALKNLEYLDEIGLMGEYGFYEAIDNGKIIKSYMAHHQGMIIQALTKLLSDDFGNKFSENPQISAAKLLLGEPDSNISAKRKKIYSVREELLDPAYTITGISAIPYRRFYSNGRYYFTCNERGENYSCFDGFGIDVEDETGDKIELEYNGIKYNILSCNITVYNRHNVKYIYNNRDIKTETTISVLSGINGDMRKILLKNIGAKPLNIKIMATKRICLCKYEDYLAHPIFSQMNIETDIDKKLNYIYAKKKNTPLYLAHFTSEKNSHYNCNGIFERCNAKEKNFGYTLYPILQSVTELTVNPGENREINIFNIVSYDPAFFNRIIPLLKTKSFANSMTGSDYALNKIFSIDKDISELASIIAGKCRLPDISLKHLINIGLPLVTERIRFSFELAIEKKRLMELSELYNYGIRFNLCLIVSRDIRIQVDKLLELIDFNSKVKYGKFIILEDDDKELCDRLIRNSVQIDSDAFNTYYNSAMTEEHEKDNRDRDNLDNEIKYKMGIGGFNEKFEYLIPLDKQTPKPWCNIFAEDDFGSIVSESGGGFTFARNSRQEKITEFKNNCIDDIPSEKVLLFDNDTFSLRSATSKPYGRGQQYTKHGFGYSKFQTNYDNIKSTLTEFVYEKNKYFVLNIENHTENDINLNIILACDFVLGDFAEYTLNALISKKITDSLIVENPLNNMRIYMRCNKEAHPIDLGDIGALGKIPFALNGKVWLKPNTGALICPCKINKHFSENIVFSLGNENYDFNYDTTLKNIQIKYDKLTMIDINTNKPDIDALLKWLPYQTYNSRFLAKTGYYQVSGAFGFRDQLQDCLTMLYINPELVKKHILKCASRQYESGDVQHWWHYPDDVGIRTRFCDDRLFLPLIVSEYISFTGDRNILTEKINYLKNEVIPISRKDLYHLAQKSEICESLEEHCLNCIYSEKISSKGMLLIGGGDWCDAMDALGIKGNGITAWGTMFLYYVINKFIPFVSSQQDKKKLLALRFKLLDGANRCWDKDRYIRAISDDGLIIGAENSTECKIDLLTQSWSVISGVADETKGLVALNKAGDLIDRNHGLIKLLDPPFEKTPGIGYISEYPPGIRENGGQYTHAAIWYIISLFLSEKNEEAYNLIKLINPINHSRSYQDVLEYKTEPYVICGDVYSGDKAGEGGWSWYTGAASWMYVCFIEYLFGIKISGQSIKFDPRLPDEIDNVNIKISLPFGVLGIKIDNQNKNGKWKILIENRIHSTDTLILHPELVNKNITVKRL